MKVERFEDLECWKQARTLTSFVYGLCDGKLLNQDRRLRDQLTGAAISVMNNIAEGFGSQSNPELKRFLGYARRSVSEVQSCLYVAFDRRFLSEEKFKEGYERSVVARKLIDGFLRYLRTQRTKPTKLI